MLDRERTINTILEKSAIQNVYIVDIKLSDDKSCVIRGRDGYYIGIDYDQVQSCAELRCLVYHELGHIATNSLYTADAPTAEQERKERIAHQWAITHCVPFDDLRAALTNGVSDVYQLSEYFCITVDAAMKVLDYYKDRAVYFIQMFYGEAV